MTFKPSFWRSLSVLLALGLVLSACNLPGTTQQLSPPEETATAGVVGTQVEQTVRAQNSGQESGDSNGAETPAATEADGNQGAATPAEGATATITPSPTIEHQTTPGSPGPTDKFITDRSTRPYASEQRAIADNFDINFLERPYTAQDMEYKPWLDLTRAEISANIPWVYIDLSLEETPPSESEARYGTEIDVDMDGRGDWLIWGASPSATDWTVADVHALEDANNDVGGDRPMRAEGAAAAGDGYENEVFNSGRGADPDTAWIRRSPSSDSDIQLAFKYSLIGSPNEFLWGAWTDNGLKEPGSFDYHDSLSIEEAGSPVSNSNYYPVKELAEVDNTCRWTYGFEPTRNLPGMCPLPETPTPTPTFTATAPPTKATYTISGIVFFDKDGDGRQDANEDGLSGATVSLRSLSCARTASETITTDSSGSFSWSGLSSGTWCVTLDSNPGGYSVNTTSLEQSFSLNNDQSVIFGITVGT